MAGPLPRQLEGQAVLGEPRLVTTRSSSRHGPRGALDRDLDGGSGLEDWLKTYFEGRGGDPRFLPRLGAPGDLAKAWHGACMEAAVAASAEWSHRLKHEGGLERLFEQRRGLPGSRRLEGVAGDGDLLRTLPSHGLSAIRVQGLVDRFGADRAACKTVVNQRLGGGMRWGEAGSDGVCHLRSVPERKKGQDAFWTRPRMAG